MKMINPTDDQLDTAFAEKVAGWSNVKYGIGWPMLDYPSTPKPHPERIPNFTQSVDAVLPWLEKCNCWNMDFDQGEIEEITINVWSPHHGQFVGQSSLPRALCIALLRANGVEVEFSQ